MSSSPFRNKQTLENIKKDLFLELLNKYESLEKDLHLDKSLVFNIPWWDNLRYPLFQEILHELSLLERPSSKQLRSYLPNYLKKIVRLVLSSLSVFAPCSPLMMRRNSILIWGHPRRKYENGFFVDIYTDPLVRMFPKNSHCSVLVRGIKSKHLSPFSVHSFYCADCLIAIGQVFAFVSSVLRREKSNNSVVNKLEKRIAKDFGLTLNVQERVFRSASNWYGQQIIMYLFLLLKKPSHIFLVVSAGNEPLIAAAKAAKIPVLELQHGSPARGKLNYDYSSGITKTNFPDYFLSFGQYWSRSLSLPLSSRKIINFGFPYLYQKLNDYSEVPKENCLLVISQSVHASSLAQFAIEVASFNTDIEVIFKAHPTEFNGVEPKYFSSLRDCGIEIASQDVDLYFLFAKARWQVGVYSTALYEGLCFDTVLSLLALPGYECMMPLVVSGSARVLKNSRDFDPNWLPKKTNIKKIFCSPSTNLLQEILDLTVLP